MPDEVLATTQRRICRRIGNIAADRTRLTGGRPRATTTTTTTLPAWHVLELRDARVRISPASDRLRRSVVAGLCAGYRRCRPRHRYPGSAPAETSGYPPSCTTAPGCRAARTSTPTSHAKARRRSTTLGLRTGTGPMTPTLRSRLVALRSRTSREAPGSVSRRPLA